MNGIYEDALSEYFPIPDPWDQFFSPRDESKCTWLCGTFLCASIWTEKCQNFGKNFGQVQQFQNAQNSIAANNNTGGELIYPTFLLV